MSDSAKWQANLMPNSSTNNRHPQQKSDRSAESNNDHSGGSYSSLSMNTPAPVTILPKLPSAAITNQDNRKVLRPSPYPPIRYSIYPFQNKSNGAIATQGKPESQRSRTARACDLCRRKKIKCNTDGPGSTCVYCKSISIGCTFTESGKKRGPPKGYTESLEGRLKRMEKMLSTMLEQPNDVSPKKPKLSHERPELSSATIHKETKDIIVYEMNPADASNKEDITDSFDISSISTELRTRFIGNKDPLTFLGDKLNIRSNFITRALGFRIKKVGGSLVFKPDDDTEKNGNLRFLEGLGMLKPGETIKGMNSWIYKISGLDRRTSDSLMKIYFAYIHPKLPVLNKSLFLRQYRGEFNEYPSAPLLNAIYGAAARYIEICKKFGDPIQLDDDMEIKDGQSDHFFDCLIVYVQRKYSPCISAVQAVLIGQNHKFGLDQKVGSRWLLSSVAIRMAQDLGLHRSSEDWDIPASEKETRKRVWWSVYILDRWTAAGTGRPQTIYDDDCDVDYPNESTSWEEAMDIPNNNNEDEDTTRFPSIFDQETPSHDDVPMYRSFVELSKLSKILGDILQGLYTPVAKHHSEIHGSNAVVTYIDDALSKWRNALPEDINFSKMEKKDASVLSKSGMIYVSYCTLLILLHRPFIEKEGGPNTRSSQSSLSICTSAATRILDVALKMHYRDWLLISWNFVTYPVFSAAVIHVNNATSPDKRLADMAKSNMLKSSIFIKNLAATSPGAGQLHDILDQLTKLRDITIGADKILQNFTSKHGYTKTRFVPERAAQVEAPYKRVSEITHGPSTEQPPTALNGDLIVNYGNQSVYSQQLPEQFDQEKLHLYPNEQESFTPMLPLEVESYSLRQFGLNMDSSNAGFYNASTDTTGHPTQPMYTNNDYTVPTNLFGNFGFVMSSTHTQPFENSTYSLMDQTTFRNRPDNAFWSVPSSMVLDDWLAYLLPQQSNSMESTSESWHQSRQNWM